MGGCGVPLRWMYDLPTGWETLVFAIGKKQNGVK